MPLDVNDYEKIAAMIGRLEAKIDLWRKEVPTTEMQALVTKGINDRITDLDDRLSALENAPWVWLLRLGVIASFVLSVIGLLSHIRLLP